MNSNYYLGRDTSPLTIKVAKSEGDFLFSDDGKKYIDFSTGWCGILGWGNKAVINAIRSFNGPAYVDPYYQYEPWEELAKTLVNISPGKMSKAFRATGGTEAVEIALQAAMRHTHRSIFISPEGYHGHSFAALSVGFSHYRNTFPNLLSCEKITLPLNKNAAKTVAERISRGDIAAYISEPIICNQGLIEPTQEYFEVIQHACRKYGTVFIIDEVATGFGRTGRLFASEYYGLNPDIVCLGKGLTGGYAALGATLMNKKLSKAMTHEFSYYSTFGWHPLNVHITLVYLSQLLKNKTRVLKHINELEIYFSQRLNRMKWPVPVEIRSKGVAMAIEFKEDGYAKQVMQKCLHKGLLIGELGPFILTLFPSGILNFDIAEEGLNILENCL